MPANTCIAPKALEPRTAAEARREFACAADPPRRRLAQSPAQGVIWGQLALTDCIAESGAAAPDRLPAIASATAGSPGLHAANLIAQADRLEFQAACSEAFSPWGRKGARVQNFNARYKRQQAAKLRAEAAAQDTEAFWAEVAERYSTAVRILGAQRPQSTAAGRIWPGPYFNPCPYGPPSGPFEGV